MGLRIWKVDWPNHLIGFFSALFGILIAFELEEWRENRNNQEEARQAFEKLRQEIQTNKSTLHEMVATNQQLLDLMVMELLPHLNENLLFQGDASEAMRVNRRCGLVAHIEVNDSTAREVKLPVNIFMNSLIRPPLHYSAWESAKATGVVNHIEYEKVLAISYLYNIPGITDELQEIRRLLRSADESTSKSTLSKLIIELKESHNVIQLELENFDGFSDIVQAME
jgi:hypothetical protein